MLFLKAPSGAFLFLILSFEAISQFYIKHTASPIYSLYFLIASNIRHSHWRLSLQNEWLMV